MEFEQQMMVWADKANDDLTSAEHKSRAVAYDKQAQRYECLAKEAKRRAKLHRKLAVMKSR